MPVFARVRASFSGIFHFDKSRSLSSPPGCLWQAHAYQKGPRRRALRILIAASGLIFHAPATPVAMPNIHPEIATSTTFTPSADGDNGECDKLVTWSTEGRMRNHVLL
jgi:hypothetical protein